MFGPSIGGLLTHISLSAPFYVAAGLTLLNAIYGYFVLPESLSKEHRMADFSLHHLNPFTQIQYVMKNHTLKFLMIIGFFYFFAFAGMGGVMSILLKDTLHWGPDTIGFYFLFLGIGDMFTQGYLTGKLLPKLGTVKLVAGGFLVTAIAFGINAVIPLFPLVVLAYAYILIYALGSGLFEPSFGGLVSSVASPQEQGRVSGASQSVQSFTRIIGPLFTVYLYQFGPSIPWISCVIFSLLGIWLLMIYKKEITAHIHANPQG
jgi:DHA1 family tetracycline resistance protein-like MFS transporter